MSTIPNYRSRLHADQLDDGRLLTMAEAGARMGVSLRMVRRLTSERRLAYVKVGKHVRIPATAVDAFIAAGYVPALHSPEPRVRQDRAYGLGREKGSFIMSAEGHPASPEDNP